MTVSGIINVNKPQGITSFRVVDIVRRGSGQRKAGHAGTLDPAATGVLLILLGQAVRVSEYLMDLPKVYRGTVRLGVATDTYDAEGETVRTSAVPALTEDTVRETLREFEGEIEQTPPAYSAVKVGGTPAHRLARRGQAPELRKRKASIYRITLLACDPPDLTIEVECGKGTYIRTLAHDIGERLGCGAHLAALERTRTGPFRVEDAATMPELEAALESGSWPDLVQPMDHGLTALPQVTALMEDEKDLRHGQAVSMEPPAHQDAGRPFRAYAEDGSLIGIVEYDAEAAIWRPVKIFAPAQRTSATAGAGGPDH